MTRTPELLKIEKLMKILFYSLFLYIFLSCSPTLNIGELEQRINSHYAASTVGNFEYFYKNTPANYIKEFGEHVVRKKLYEMYGDVENPEFFNDIGELHVQDIKKM